LQKRTVSPAFSLLPLFLLLTVTVSAGFAARQPEVLPLEFQADIPNGYFEPIPIDAAAGTNSIVFDVSSNATITTAFMSSSQFSSFNDTGSDIANSIFIQNGTASQDTVHVSKGDFFLVFNAYDGNANVTYNYDLYPNSPYYAGPISAPEPSGIATFGLDNASGNVTPYNVAAHEVVGVADISSLLAHNSTADSANSTVSGATLQLNSVLVINEKGGAQQVYWTQNTPDFVTSASQVAYGDNIWNYSVSGFLSNTTITSSNGGYAYSFSQSGLTQYNYAQEISNSSYALPLDLALAINETVVPGQGVVVQMGAQELRNGSEPATPMDWFDNATIHDPTAQSAYFYVSGNSTTPEGTFYDTEFVFGGENDGESTSFSQMSASMQLLYDNTTSGVLAYFPSYYSFGQDTAEGADNLHVSYSGNGIVEVSPGAVNYVYLGGASGTSSLSQLAVSATSVSASTSQSSSLGAAGTTSSVPEYLIGSLVVVALVIVAAVAITRRSGKAPTPG
jgi:thermopsin